MLLNPASADRMQPNREEKCEHEVKKTRPTAKINDCHVVEHRTRKINKEPAVPHLDRFQTGWACQLKEWKEHEPDGLAIPSITDQARFPVVCQVRVIFVIALMRMMLQMIDAETHRPRRKIRKIGDDSHHLVPAFVPENQVVSCVVNDDVIGMIRECANAIGDEKTEPPVTKPKAPHPKGDPRLHDHDRDGDERRPRIAHHQLPDFRMRFNDRARPPRMGLVRFRLIKRVLHHLSKYALQAPPQTRFFNGAPPSSGNTNRFARISMMHPARTTRPKRCVGGKSDNTKMAKPTAMIPSEYTIPRHCSSRAKTHASHPFFPSRCARRTPKTRWIIESMAIPIQTFVAGAEMTSTGTWNQPMPPSIDSGTRVTLAIIATAPRTDRATTHAITMNNRFSQNKPVTKLSATSLASRPCK